MAQKLSNAARNKHMQVRTAGVEYVLLPNGKKVWCLTTAVTANVTLDDAVATTPVTGDYACTSHATGIGSIFVSDGTKWQFLTNA